MMTQTRREARLQVVHDHIQFEREHASNELVRTFGNSPKWHNKPGNEVFSGHDEIRGFYLDLFQGFPDFWLDIQSEHVTDEAVIVEGRFGGTHTGTWMGLAPTSKKVGVSFCAVFSFTDDDRLKSETAYYDRYSILSQLGVVPATRPDHAGQYQYGAWFNTEVLTYDRVDPVLSSSRHISA